MFYKLNCLFSFPAENNREDHKAKNRNEKQHDILAKDKHEDKEGHFSCKSILYPKRRNGLP